MSRTPGKNFVTGFAPILPRKPKVLILGSMPGVASLDKRQYYGHPGNLFWPIVGKVLGFSPALPYRGRVACLQSAGIALWDVLHACERKGSADNAIVPSTERANAVDKLLQVYPQLRFVLLNGGKAHAAFRKHIVPELSARRQARLRLVCLPSTSPANAASARDKKIKCWTDALRQALDGEANGVKLQ